MRYRLLFLCLIPAVALAQQQISSLRQRLAVEDDPGKIKISLEISKFYEASQPDSAVHYCNIAMQIAERRNDRHSQGLLLLALGRINTLHHHLDLARKFDNEALSVFRSINEPQGIAQAYNDLGSLDGQQQDLNNATKDFGKAMQFYEDSHDSTGILETYRGLGKVYEGKDDIEKALTYYLRAIVQYEHRVQKTEAYFTLLQSIGHLYERKGDSRNALKYLQEGVYDSNSSAFRDTQLILMNDEGKLMEQEGQKTKALEYYKQAMSKAKKFNQPEQEAEALIHIADVLKKENAAQSLDDLKKALHIADSLHQPQLEARIYAGLSGVYRQEKNYKEAMTALEENHRLLDSLLDSDTTKEIAALDSSYTLESSRDKIGSLQKVNREEKTELDMGLIILFVVFLLLFLLGWYFRKISKLNRELTVANHVKDTLFSIIGHDLKGPAGSAMQLFTLMETEDFTEEELKGMISELKKQTGSSFELLQSLFDWGNAQLQGVRVSAETLDAKSIIQKNIDLLKSQAELKKITIHDQTPPGMLVFADPHHVDFIIRNLLANALKFTYEHGRVDLDAKEVDGDIVFSVKDNGKGIGADQQHSFLKYNLRVSFGTRGEKGSGLGLLLIKDFIRANKGRIWLQSEEGKGSVFYFSLPRAR